MKNNFTDFVRESVIGKWLNLQINTPKKYLLNFNIDDFYYKDLFRSKLDLLVRKISKESFKYYNKNIMVGIETGFKLSVGKNYKFIERYISEDLWEKLLSTYRMDSYENIWEALFLCHQLFRAVSGEVAERLHYAYPEYDRNITKYTRDMYKKYTGKTGCLDSTYAADIEERREQ